jgi:hypothetical protein
MKSGNDKTCKKIFITKFHMKQMGMKIKQKSEETELFFSFYNQLHGL